MSDTCICVNGPETTCPVHGRRARGRPPTMPRSRRKGDVPAATVPIHVLETERDQAMVAALFYWQLAERQGTAHTDYEYRAGKAAARALDRQQAIDRAPKPAGGG